MAFKYLLFDIADSVAIVTINREPVNALNSEAYFELYELFYKISIDDKIKVVILTGFGERAFVAGADVKEFLDLDSDTGILYTKKNQFIREFIRQYNKPIICGINGLAYGGGCALTLMCDIRIACEGAKMNLGEINMGILGATQYIAQISTAGIARKLVYSGESITAEEALRAGIIDEIVPREQLMDRCLSLAKKIASKPPVALKYAKQCMNTSQEVLLEEGLKFEEDSLKVLWGTRDKDEAVNAFLQKREPNFEGK